jgi:hypothetical protein
MVCLCSSCALCVNHLTHNQQIPRSTLIGNIYYYQLFTTFNRISFKYMESLVFMCFPGGRVLSGYVLTQSDFQRFLCVQLICGIVLRNAGEASSPFNATFLPILFWTKKYFKGKTCLPHLKNDCC